MSANKKQQQHQASEMKFGNFDESIGTSEDVVIASQEPKPQQQQGAPAPQKDSSPPVSTGAPSSFNKNAKPFVPSSRPSASPSSPIPNPNPNAQFPRFNPYNPNYPNFQNPQFFPSSPVSQPHIQPASPAAAAAAAAAAASPQKKLAIINPSTGENILDAVKKPQDAKATPSTGMSASSKPFVPSSATPTSPVPSASPVTSSATSSSSPAPSEAAPAKERNEEEKSQPQEEEKPQPKEEEKPEPKEAPKVVEKPEELKAPAEEASKGLANGVSQDFEDDASYEDEEESDYEPEEITIFEKYGKEVTYPPQVWSPENRDGVKRYPKEFLLCFEFYDQKPASFVLPPPLQNLPVSKSNLSEKLASMIKVNVKHHRNKSQGGQPQGGAPRPGAVDKRRQSSRGKGKREDEANLPPVEPLKVSENRWIRPTNEADSEDAQNEILIRKYRGLLNKLTVEKFESISAELLSIEIKSPLILKSLIHLIFDKATDEPNFSSMYASLCEKVQKHAPSFENNSFRRLLLNTCQEEFERPEEVHPLTEEERNNMNQEQIDDHEYRQLKQKRRILGNMIFIGELFKLEMLTEKIIHSCIFKLLSTVDERDLECLCNLLKTVGKKLDTSKAEKVLNSYFDRMRQLSTLESLSSRIRFMLMDIIDLRSNNWVPRREELKAKKIDDIHQEAIQEEARRSSGGGSRDSRPDSRRSSGRGSMPNLSQQAHMRRTMSGPPKRQPEGADISKLPSYSQRPQEKKDPVLAPPSYNKNSVQRSPSAGSPSLATNINKFSLLQEDEPKKGRSESRSRESKQAQPREPSSFQVAEPSLKEGPAPTPVVPSISHDKFNATIEGNLKEFFETRSLEDAVAYTEELKGCAEWFHEMVSTILNQSMEKKEDQKKSAIQLLSHLYSKKLLTVQDLTKGLESVLEFADDLVIDVPTFPEFIGGVLAGLILEGKAPISLLSGLGSLKNSGSTRRITTALFKLIVERVQEEGARSIIGDFNITSALPEDAQTKPEAYGLGFLKSSSEETSSKLTEELQTQLESGNSDDAIQWILKEKKDLLSQPSFSFSLMAAAMKAFERVTKHDPSKDAFFTSTATVLHRFLDLNVELHLQAIAAIQTYFAQSSQSKELINWYFRRFYDLDVLVEESFKRWKESKDNKHPGKAEALENSKQFLSFLENARPE